MMASATNFGIICNGLIIAIIIAFGVIIPGNSHSTICRA